MFLHRISWDVARRQGSGSGGTLAGLIPRKVGMWGTGKHTTFSCREGQARRIQGSIPPSPKLLLLLLFFFFCPKLLERVPRSILKGQAMEGQGSWLQTSGCRNSLSLVTVHHVGQVMRFLYPFHKTDVHWGCGKGPHSCSHCSPP